MRIQRTNTELHHVARCDTCTGTEGSALVLLPDGAAGRTPDLAARAHLIANPDHLVSMSYVVEAAYLMVPDRPKLAKPLIGPGSPDGGK